MAGYWPSSFFLRVYGPRRSRVPKHAISSHLDRTSLVNKGFIIWGKTPKNDLAGPSEKSGKIAPSCGMELSCPLG